MKFNSMNKSINFTENVLEGADAIEASIFRLMTTAIGSLPELPTLGFEMAEFFGLSENSSIYSELSEELKQKIIQVVGDERVDIVISRQRGSDTIDFTISYFDTNNRRHLMPFSYAMENGRYRIHFKDIAIE